MMIEATPPFTLNDRMAVNPQEKIAAPFSSWISDFNHSLIQADQSLEKLASGKSESLHKDMLVLEEAKLSFQFLEQVRNRLMTAYQEILREQI